MKVRCDHYTPRRRRCKYCGAVLKMDIVGLKCPTRNCQWEYGIDEKDDVPEVRCVRVKEAGG